VKLNDSIVDNAVMSNTGPSIYEGKLVLRKAGKYEIALYAYDPATNNTGVAKKTITVK
jgi:hypothetical protein